MTCPKCFEQAKLLKIGNERLGILLDRIGELQRLLFQCNTENKNLHKENCRLWEEIRNLKK